MSDIGPQGRRFHVVPFSGTDYSLGAHLLEKDGATSTEGSEISAKLSLLFQWPEYSWAGAIIPATEDTFVCRLNYDRDEAAPTELQLKFQGDQNLDSLRFLKKIRIRYELFRVCYEFETSVLAVADATDTPWDLILSVPEKLVTFKQRRLPRVRIPENLPRSLPSVYCLFSDGSRSQNLTILEMGLNSVVAESVIASVNPPSFLVFETSPLLQIPVETISKKGRLIFKLQMPDNETFCRFFDVYRLVAYPGLVPRASLPPESVFRLYEATGYLGGFEASQGFSERDLLGEVIETWNAIGENKADCTADYIVVDSNEQPNGASSVVKAFSDGEYDYWAFHQLCSQKSPDLLSASGYLYTWRAEFLAGRIGELKGIVWFRSESRWLERIYTKFSKQCPENTSLYAVKLLKGNVRSSGRQVSKGDLPVKAECFGTTQRFVSTSQSYLSGLNPGRLNVSGLLNHVIGFSDEGVSSDVEKVIVAAETLLKHAAINDAEFYLSVNAQTETPATGWRVTQSDRMCIFTKEGLLDFLTCVEHSIAVTLRKLEE